MPNRKLEPRYVDGKLVRIFLFGRKSSLSAHPVLWQVEGFSKDHALDRLCELEHWIARREWHFIDELDPEHDVGAMGRKLRIEDSTAAPRLTAIAGMIRPLFTPNKKLH